jgi:hypothetical protein
VLLRGTGVWVVGVTAGSRVVPGKKPVTIDKDNNNNNNNNVVNAEL